jgi:N-acetylglucosaminyldiphosphoundecaprenol N-acetyl-beta-D-mannosaminyltransferase
MSTSLMGVCLTSLSEQETVQHVLDDLDHGTGGWVCPVNLDVMRQVDASADVRDLVAGADLLVADGMPLVWASHVRGAPLPERVAGSALVHSLSAAAARHRRSVFLLGGNPGAAAAAAQLLAEQEPGLPIAGTLCPPMGFENDAAELSQIESALLETRPDIVFVGLGFPKQDRLVAHLRPLLPQTWFLSCGISFSFVSGEIVRAPTIVQRLGLEWLHRMFQEPRRLARRYLLDGLPFLARMLASALRERRAGRPA